MKTLIILTTILTISILAVFAVILFLSQDLRITRIITVFAMLLHFIVVLLIVIKEGMEKMLIDTSISALFSIIFAIFVFISVSLSNTIYSLTMSIVLAIVLAVFLSPLLVIFSPKERKINFFLAFISFLIEGTAIYFGIQFIPGWILK